MIERLKSAWIYVYITKENSFGYVPFPFGSSPFPAASFYFVGENLNFKDFIVRRNKEMKPVMCEKKTYTVAEIMQILGIGRTAAYDLTRKGLFKVIRVGKILRINKESFDQWFDSQQ